MFNVLAKIKIFLTLKIVLLYIQFSLNYFLFKLHHKEIFLKRPLNFYVRKIIREKVKDYIYIYFFLIVFLQKIVQNCKIVHSF